MVQFTTNLLRFDIQADKTGWTYIEVSADLVEQIKPNCRKGFRVKGKLDNHKISASLIPLGGGRMILPVNGPMRKAIGKGKGAMVTVQLQEDKKQYQLNKDFLECLADEPAAHAFFQTLTPSHQRYFSKWIEDAKSIETKTKRITLAVNGLARKMDYGAILRENSSKRS